MSKLVKIFSKQEIGPNQVESFQIGDKYLAICQLDGKYYAFDELCTHQFGPLSDGWLEGYTIECPLHGARFDVRNGEAICLPAVEKLQTYKVVVQGESIMIELDGDDL
jgi:3-phenylpropionate/trans-cinnamate dioxygenase ferredoxin subunit